MKTSGRAGWSRAAESLAQALPLEHLHPAAISWARRARASEAWAVALSGGADSVALLLLLWAHFPSRRRNMVAFHFDHRLRGAESSADARFCARLCRALGITLVSGKWSRPGAGGEAEARAARFSFIESRMARRGMRALWLGQQQDDIAETMLMRLARGSGTGGLAAPRAVHVLARSAPGRPIRIHLRPLLTLKKSEISRALESAGGAWREDSSNRLGKHFRNRLRKDVVPGWIKSSGRDAQAGAALSRELLEEDDGALEAWVDDLWSLGRDGSLDLGPFIGKPRAVARRALHRWILRQKRAGDLSRQGFQALLSSFEQALPVRHSLGSHGFAVISEGRLRFVTVRKDRTFH
jgi:tRNA(Ile)-lysidine synthase